jgi:hypothetical protein
MFGFIKKLFGGIFAFIGGLFGGKKSGDNASTAPKIKKSKGYFLELDEAGNAIAQAPAKLVEAVKSELTSDDKKPEPVKAALAKAEPPKAEAPAPAKKPEPAKATSESKNGKVKIEAQPNPPAPVNNGKAQGDPTFAPNYLLPTASNSRRRPGPSLDTFRDMARQVKTPS